MAQFACYVQRGVALVAEVWVAQSMWVVLDYSSDEEGVIEVDCAAEADADVDPGDLVYL